MPGLAMALLAARLARRGYAPRAFGYSGRESLESNLERLQQFARAAPGAHFIGHSLGGVLIFDMLSRHPEIKAASVLLLGAPVRGCLTGRKLGSVGFGRWMMGACGPRWAECDPVWRRPEPLGVVAGTVAFGLGRGLGRLPGLNDGVVRVEEAEVQGMAARTLVPLGHSFLIVSTRVERLAERFLAEGRFE